MGIERGIAARFVPKPVDPAWELWAAAQYVWKNEGDQAAIEVVREGMKPELTPEVAAALEAIRRRIDWACGDDCHPEPRGHEPGCNAALDAHTTLAAVFREPKP